MNCEEADNLIIARIDGEIAPDDRRLLESHLATCPACQTTAEAMAAQDVELLAAFEGRVERLAGRVIGSVESGRVAVEEPARTEAPVAAANPPLKIREREGFWIRWGRPLLAAAAGFGLAIVITRPWEKATPSVVTVAATNPAVVPASRPIAQLALATGKVFVCPQGSDDWRPLETGGDVAAGMKVRTGPKVRCEFAMADGSEVRLNAGTEVTLASAKRVDVTGGQVFSSVRNSSKLADAFVVSAGPARTTMSGVGTAFDLSCGGKDATLTVVDGAVNVASSSGAAAASVVRGGEAITVSDGVPGEKRTVENLMRATQWVDEILVMKGRDNPELAKRVDDIFAQLGHEKMFFMNAQEVRRLGDHCVVPLARYIQSPRSEATRDDEMKRREAARIIADVATTRSIPELINLLGDKDGEVRQSAAGALRRLTGQDMGQNAAAWRDHSLAGCAPAIEDWHAWWANNKGRFPGADPDAVRPPQPMKKARG